MEWLINQIALRQHGVFSRLQALEAGFTEKQIRARRQAGVWVEVAIGVYRHGATPLTWRGRVMAAVLSSGGVASHRTAAALHGLLPETDIVEVTAERNRYFRKTRTIVHWLTDLDRDRDLTIVDGIPATDPARTLVDLGAVVPVERLEAVAHRAFGRELVPPSAVFERLDALARPGRGGVSRLRLVLARFDFDQLAAESDWEVRLFQILRRGDLPLPVRQYRIWVDGREIRFDLAYPRPKLFLEYDGIDAHTGRRALEKDDARQNLAVVAGWRPLRFTKAHVWSHPDAVCKTVAAALDLALSW